MIERLAKLDRLAGGITSCRATLAREQPSHQQGNLYSVMVEVRIPPQHDLGARKQNNIRDMPAQLPALINQAFGAIERQLTKTTEVMSALTIRLPDDKHQRLKELAKRRQTSLNRLIDEMLVEFDAETRFLLRAKRGRAKRRAASSC